MIEKIGILGAMKVNNFHKQLKQSESYDCLSLVLRILNKMYPNNNGTDEVTCLAAQSKGLDRILYLDTWEVKGVEYKIRETAYNDILFEFISNDYTKTLGWAEKDLICDIFIYGWNPLRTVYGFEWVDLKRVWILNKNNWKRNYKVIEAKNSYYSTHSVCVPIKEVLNKLNSEFFVYKEEK